MGSSYVGRHRTAVSSRALSSVLRRPAAVVAVAGLGTVSGAGSGVLFGGGPQTVSSSATAAELSNGTGLTTGSAAAAASAAHAEAGRLLRARTAQAAAASRSALRVSATSRLTSVVVRHVATVADARMKAAARANRALLSANPRVLGQALAAGHGWHGEQFSCLNKLWTKESQWTVKATNPSSGAYGIPQSLPAGKMASAGADWRTNPATQIRWGLTYIKDRYGSPCRAWAHSQATNWY